MKNRPKPINPARVMAAGFIGLIIIGTILLSLPLSHGSQEFSFIDALFTATSAVCVTGLVVVDTGTFFTVFGQTVIMLLILFGAIGFMTMTTIIFIFLGRPISLRRSLVVKEVLGQESLQGLQVMVINVVLMSFLFIIIGTILLSIRFVPQLGGSQGYFNALFHSISAFGNAGFDLTGNYESLTGTPVDYLVNGTIMLLFIAGGLGFTVILELSNRFQFRHRLSLHSYMVLIITAILLIGGTVLILVLEFNNPATLGTLSLPGKFFTALFTSATPRTAGFSVLDTGAMTISTQLILILLMFIGASPTSTGGGVKTTTVGVVVLTMFGMIRGRREPVIYKRRFPLHQIMKAVSIICAAMVLVFITTLIMSIFENFNFMDLLFEAFSAFGTVGLSTGITPELTIPSKIMIIITMFGGRIGPLSLLVALAGLNKKEPLLRYPEENLMIG